LNAGQESIKIWCPRGSKCEGGLLGHYSVHNYVVKLAMARGPLERPGGYATVPEKRAVARRLPRSAAAKQCKNSVRRGSAAVRLVDARGTRRQHPGSLASAAGEPRVLPVSVPRPGARKALLLHVGHVGRAQGVALHLGPTAAASHDNGGGAAAAAQRGRCLVPTAVHCMAAAAECIDLQGRGRRAGGRVCCSLG
jgi:hypothetical protein